MGDSWSRANALDNLGRVVCEQGDYGRALALYAECLTLQRDLRDQAGAARCLEGVAGVAHAQGELERAARLLGAAAALREATGATVMAAERTRATRIAADARLALGEGAYLAAWAAGQALSLEQAIAEGFGEDVAPNSSGASG